MGYHDFGDYQGVGFQRPRVMAGGIPLILSRVEGGTIDDQFDVVDAVVIGGGRDIEPAPLRPGAPRGSGAVRSAPRRVRARPRRAASVDRGLPLLGMCRGSQVVNVALGGTLVQDVSLRARVGEAPDRPRLGGWKEVERASLNDLPGRAGFIRATPCMSSRAHGSTPRSGVDEIEVNSFHHQAIETLAPGLRATGVAPDGVVEVIEFGEDDGYVLAAQFELQGGGRVDRRFLAPFEQLVARPPPPPGAVARSRGRDGSRRPPSLRSF